MNELAIKSNRVVTPGGVINAYVLIKDGLITGVVNALPECFSAEVVDVGEAVLMPGVIDPHVHINEPGRTDWEGFETATKAAVCGGITTLVDMPLNSLPVTTTAEAFDKKFAAAKNKIHVNVGFWGGIVPGNENEIEALVDKGVPGFKAFLTHSGIVEFPNVTEEDLRKAMPIIAKHSLPLLVHCELSEDVKYQTSDVRSYREYLSSRPEEWEDKAIAMMIRLCEEFDCRVHVVHLSSANSINQIAKAKARGLPLTVETAQHYLYFCAEQISDGNTAFKCAPPIRNHANNELLWQALKEGITDFVATDHSPSPAQIKELESGDFTKAWGGISSIQFALPALWTAAKQRGCTLNDLVKWLCEKPSQLAGTAKAKGRIAEGFDADLIVFHDDKTFRVTEDIIQHRHKITPYLNELLFGVVEQTFLAGERVFNKGAFTKQNKGQIVTRT